MILMLKNLYVLFDNIAKEGGNVFTAKNDQVACRQVQNTLRESEFMNPKEYILYKVGSYDPELVSVIPTKEVIDFLEVMNKKVMEIVENVKQTSISNGR